MDIPKGSRHLIRKLPGFEHYSLGSQHLGLHGKAQATWTTSKDCYLKLRMETQNLFKIIKALRKIYED